jgi:hypothetical protein
MTDYTPTTDEVRDWYGDDVTDADRAWELAKRAEFDRWLAAHDKEVLDRAVERVQELGCNDNCGCSITIPNATAAIRGEGERA